LSERDAPRGVEDEVGCESPRGSANILEPHARDAAIVRRGDQLGDAGAGSQFDIRLLFDPVAANALERRARQSELVVSEVALRKRIETGQFQAYIAAKPYPHSAGVHEIDLEPGKQAIEREMAAREQRMRVARLRRPRMRRRRVTQ
jgi:hypothetical protein